MKLDKKIRISGDTSTSYSPYAFKKDKLSFSGRYVCVYIVDKAGNYSYIYGAGRFCEDNFRRNIKTSYIHKYACKAAFAGKRVAYDWFENEPVPTFFNTIAIPLGDKDGSITSLLLITKALDEVFIHHNNTMILAEKAGQSFVRIIMQAREEEKRLITSAIHDQLGNFSIKSNAFIELLKEDLTNTNVSKKALETLGLLQQSLLESVHAMKEIITSYRPLQLDAVGLNASVKELLEKIKQTESIKVKYSYKIKEKTVLSKNARLILYRAVQEALSNTVKYAEATTLTVEFKEDKFFLYLTIKDDGKGFEPQVHRSAKNLGLAGMKENIASLKGTMKLTSKLGKGTAIMIKCPKFNYLR